MQLLEKDIRIAEENASEFISLKYLDDSFQLKQIDASINAVRSGNFSISTLGINLKPIEGKNFLDPFTSRMTTNFFCENISNKNDSRIIASQHTKAIKSSCKLDLSAEIHFSTSQDNNKTSEEYNIDSNANLRSDIIATLEKINIETTNHFATSDQEESIIGISAKNIIDLADNFVITRYIIGNIANAYGKSAKFITNKKFNLSLIARSDRQNIQTLNALLLEKINKNRTYIKTSTPIDLHTHIIYNQKEPSNFYQIQINLPCIIDFDPYLAFCDLLVYNDAS